MSDMSVQRRGPIHHQHKPEGKKADKPESQPKPEAKPPERPQNNDAGHAISGGVDSKTQFLASQGLQDKETKTGNAGNTQPDSAEAKQLADSVKIDIDPNAPQYGEVKKALEGVANDPDGNKLLKNAVDKGLNIKLDELDGAIAYNSGDTIGLGQAAFDQGTGYLVEVLGHELSHRVSEGDGDTKNEEAIGSTLGRRIRARYEGNPMTPEQEAADYKKGVESARENPAYKDLPENTDIFDSLSDLGIEFDPGVRGAAGGSPSGNARNSNIAADRSSNAAPASSRTSNTGNSGRPSAVQNAPAADQTGGNNLMSMLEMLLTLLQQMGINTDSPMTGALADNAKDVGNTGNTGNTSSAKDISATAPTQALGSSGTADQEAFLKLINDFRAENGLAPVALNDQLNQTAQDYSQALDESGQFTHELNGSQFGDRIKEHGYNLGTGTENIAKGQQSVEEAFQSWVDSPGHRANLLNPDIKEIGLGEANHVWTQVGAAPA